VGDITMGYTVPKLKLDKMGIERMRVYFQITNPFVFTKYHGMDPEFNSTTAGDDLPTAIYTFGVNIGF
jgi:hypothetical protein